MNNTLIVKNSAVVTTSENYLPTGPMAQWIRHLTTNQGIAGSSPARVKFFFYDTMPYNSLAVENTAESVWLLNEYI